VGGRGSPRERVPPIQTALNKIDSVHAEYPIDMSSNAIASRIREVSELYALGISLSKAKPCAAPAKQAHELTTEAASNTLDVGIETKSM
jgi:hypothetical protein